MSIVVRFPTSNMTEQQYESVHEAIERSGTWPPPGLLAHVCFGDKSDLHVSEIWSSREQLEAYGDTLRPHLESAGIQFSGEPEIIEVHRAELFQPPAFTVEGLSQLDFTP